MIKGELLRDLDRAVVGVDVWKIERLMRPSRMHGSEEKNKTRTQSIDMLSVTLKRHRALITGLVPRSMITTSTTGKGQLPPGNVDFVTTITLILIKKKSTYYTSQPVSSDTPATPGRQSW
jgi:hypothetical protein